MQFPRAARSYRNWISRDLIWDCNAVPSRSEVLQRQNVGLRFPRDFVWGAMLPRTARPYSGLLLQEYAIPMAILTNMVNDFRSFRVGYNVPCCFDRFFIRAHSPVIEITLPLNSVMLARKLFYYSDKLRYFFRKWLHELMNMVRHHNKSNSFRPFLVITIF